MLEDPEALCLDGSPGAYYQFLKDPKKIMISFEGGGWCGSSSFSKTLENCYARSLTDLGSSINYPQTTSASYGLLSDDSQSYFQDWSKFHLKYCDGTGHQGQKKIAVPYKGKNLYFRGHSVTKAQIESIDQNHHLFSEATHIVITGQSAGGLAAFLWTNYIVERVKGKVWSLPDSGIFLDSMNEKTKQHSYKEQFINFMMYSNAEVDPPTNECVLHYANDQKWKCMFAQYLHQFIRVPLYPIQSLYDSWSLPNVLGIGCASGSSLVKCNKDQMKAIQQYHKNTSHVLLNVANSSRQQNGYWAPVCVNHVYSSNSAWSSIDFRIPMNSPKTLNQCVADWIQGTTDNQHMDKDVWPSNKPCSGTAVIQQTTAMP